MPIHVDVFLFDSALTPILPFVFILVRLWFGFYLVLICVFVLLGVLLTSFDWPNNK